MGGTLNQPYIFVAAIYAGMLAGLAFTILRGARRLLGAGKIVTIAVDTLFALLLFVISGAILIVCVHGELRPYFFGGIALGFFMFLFGVSPLVSYMRRLIKCKQSGKAVDKSDK